MCLSKAWIEGESAAEPFMEDIARIKVEDKRIVLTSLFGEKKSLAGKIAEIDFMRSMVVLARD